MNFRIVCLFAIAFLLVIGCASNRYAHQEKRISLTDKASLANKSLHIGMTQGEAVDLMQTIGFTCEFMENSTLSYYAKSDDTSATYLRNVNYLNCVARERNGMVTGILSFKLLIIDGKVNRQFEVWQYDGP